jgi:hypothetical protein
MIFLPRDRFVRTILGFLLMFVPRIEDGRAVRLRLGLLFGQPAVVLQRKASTL